MSETASSAKWAFGIAPNVFAKLQSLFERTPGLERVWVYGSEGEEIGPVLILTLL
jgi:hypothetical protein